MLQSRRKTDILTVDGNFQLLEVIKSGIGRELILPEINFCVPKRFISGIFFVLAAQENNAAEVVEIKFTLLFVLLLKNYQKN